MAENQPAPFTDEEIARREHLSDIRARVEEDEFDELAVEEARFVANAIMTRYRRQVSRHQFDIPPVNAVTDGARWMMNEAGRYPTLEGREQEFDMFWVHRIGALAAQRVFQEHPYDKELAWQYQRLAQMHDEAGTGIVKSNLRLAIKIAREYAQTSSHDLEDVILMAQPGLVNAFHKFDETIGTKFSTYATRSIERSIWREADREKATNTPEAVRKEVSRMRRRQRIFEQSHERLPSDEELAELMHMSVNDIRELRVADANWRGHVRLDKTLGDDTDGTTRGELMEEGTAEAARNSVESLDVLRQFRARALELELSELQIVLIAASAGLVDGETKQAAIDAQPGRLTKEHIERLERVARNKLAEDDEIVAMLSVAVSV